MTEALGQGVIPSFSNSSSPLITKRLANKKIELLQEIDVTSVSGALAKSTQQAYKKTTQESTPSVGTPQMKDIIPVAKKKGAENFYYVKVDTVAKEFGLSRNELSQVQALGTAALQVKALEFILLKKELSKLIQEKDIVGVVKILVDARSSQHSANELGKAIYPHLSQEQKTFLENAFGKVKTMAPLAVECKKAIEKKDIASFLKIVSNAREQSLPVEGILSMIPKELQNAPFTKEALEKAQKLHSLIPAQEFASALEDGDLKKIREHVGISKDSQAIRAELEKTASLLEPGIAAQTVKDCLARFDAISTSIAGETHNLKPYEILLLAAFVETAFREKPTDFQLYFPVQGSPPREVFIDSANKTFYLLSGLSMLAETRNSKVAEALKIPDGAKAERYVRKQVPATKENADEVERTKKFGDSTLIHTTAKVPLTAKMELDAIIIISKRYDFDFSKCLASAENPISLDMPQKLKNFIELGLHLFDIHSQGYVHDDVKADNAASTDGVAHLVDFGETRKAGTKTGEMRYPTPHYTAPEAVAREGLLDPSSEDKAMDVYAFGCLIYELTHSTEIPWFDVNVDLATRSSKSNAAVDMVEKQRKTHADLLNEAKEETEPLRKQALLMCAGLLDPNPKTRMTLNSFLKEMSNFDPKYKEMVVSAFNEMKWQRDLIKALAQFTKANRLDLFDKAISSRLSMCKSVHASVQKLDSEERKSLQDAYKDYLVPKLQAAIKKQDSNEILTLCKKGSLILPDNSFFEEAFTGQPERKEQVLSDLGTAMIDSHTAPEDERAVIDLMINKIAPHMR